MVQTLDQLKIDLKKWEHKFIEEHGRDPTKDDIKRWPLVKKMYKQYSSLKKGRTSHELHSTEIDEGQNVQQNLFSDLRYATAVELGPTPQIHGKAISIFEMSLSPIKQSVTVNQFQKDQLSANIIPQLDSYSSDQEEKPDVKRQLNFTTTTPNSSPFKSHDKPTQPRYYGPNSPLKLEETNIQLSIIHRSPSKQTPRKNVCASNAFCSFSPSPIVKRPLAKSLLELVQEHEAIVREFNDIDDQENVELIPSQNNHSDQETEEETDERGPSKHKRRILRRFAPQEANVTVRRNISQELAKLKQKHVNEFFGDDMPDDHHDEQPDFTREEETMAPAGSKKAPKKRKKKYNLVSNNFRRLKLPRKNSNRFRMRGRR